MRQFYFDIFPAHDSLAKKDQMGSWNTVSNSLAAHKIFSYFIVFLEEKDKRSFYNKTEGVGEQA